MTNVEFIAKHNLGKRETVPARHQLSGGNSITEHTAVDKLVHQTHTVYEYDDHTKFVIMMSKVSTLIVIYSHKKRKYFVSKCTKMSHITDQSSNTFIGCFWVNKNHVLIGNRNAYRIVFTYMPTIRIHINRMFGDYYRLPFSAKSFETLLNKLDMNKPQGKRLIGHMVKIHYPTNSLIWLLLRLKMLTYDQKLELLNSWDIPNNSIQQHPSFGQRIIKEPMALRALKRIYTIIPETRYYTFARDLVATSNDVYRRDRSIFFIRDTVQMLSKISCDRPDIYDKMLERMSGMMLAGMHDYVSRIGRKLANTAYAYQWSAYIERLIFDYNCMIREYGYYAVLPKSSDDLVNWSEDLDNCIWSYTGALSRQESILLAIKSANGTVHYNAEIVVRSALDQQSITNFSRSSLNTLHNVIFMVTQFVGHHNTYVNITDRAHDQLLKPLIGIVSSPSEHTIEFPFVTKKEELVEIDVDELCR